MKGLSLTSLRAGQRYRLINFGDRYEFEILEVMYPQDFKIKDLYTLEQYFLSDITKYGIGKDFEIRELS